ncbi:restriction endonuclease family protein [Paraburkholderia fungorum]|uniref:Restriction endonuclease family protein n=1 Tax=Paraburkholderia fungorum TaxID=134537 RepID=A0AAU8T3D5_9BURK|nr:restriction endonuclease [Paraburkholderia fungorum]AJZ60901.1 restriction endonuclease family protein [Paraburkholderia fungorum]
MDSFVGRQREIDALSAALLGPDARAAAIVGETGMGKTALARMFGHLNQEFFSAGIYSVRVTPYESLGNAIDSHVSHPTNPYLLILEYLEDKPAPELQAELHELRRSRPNARLIGTSRHDLGLKQFDLTLHLKGFERAEFYELLTKAQGVLDDKEPRDLLFDVLSGNVLGARAVADILQAGTMSPREILSRLRNFSYSGIIDANGRPIAAGAATGRQVITDVKIVSDELLREIHAEPQSVYELSPRRFEEFVAEVLDRLGYQTTLTPRSRDGGKDIYAAKKDHVASFLYIVECKRYAPDNPVGVGLVRQLNGVVQAERATAGLLATTSFFTKGAKEFQKTVANQMGLKDYLGIQEWLDAVFRQ